MKKHKFKKKDFDTRKNLIIKIKNEKDKKVQVEDIAIRLADIEIAVGLREE